MKLEGQNALVTGASRGIGRGCAIEMAKEGANVAINYRSHPEEAEEAAEEARSFGVKAITIQADVADQHSVDAAVAKVAEEFGSLDIFVSNSAYSDRELILDADMEGFKRTIDVTMWGAFFGVRAAASQMVKQDQGGAIVVISSPHAVIAIPTSAAYNMAKAAIDHMARTAAIEFAPHKIRVNTVHPGWIDTPGERKFFSDEQLKAGAENIPWKRLGSPNEVGKLVTFLSSHDADYMTGSTTTIDGGISLPWWSKRAEGEQ
ncbi:MAG: SDR family oxidoreductase [Planctomycetes bacterium]|nr:SDR family oxidoreductase [Planctomycetota bacterium]MCH9727924.1 SDR family oxidoreductase [Planctomycetota bacterium]MCH9778359.1 SDR family oxidoreductase [Planctomycetota bacterium]MDF1745114.1 SDR family NAD(P)-dependent oxidoreductase [Gimesia sp.]